MWINTGTPRISWISVAKKNGEEWVRYTKAVTVKKPIRSAVFRLECDCTAALYINGELSAAGNGRMPERVSAHEVTSRLTVGENTLTLVLGTAYFQERGISIKATRGYWLNTAAAELSIAYEDGSYDVIATDPTWNAESDGVAHPTIETAVVTEAEYGMMWQNAAIWPEARRRVTDFPEAVRRVAGDGYLAYATRKIPDYVFPTATVKTNLTACEGALVSDPASADAPFVLYDFGMTHVGFTELTLEAAEDTKVTLLHDYLETAEELEADPLHDRVKMLSVSLRVAAGESTVVNLRRRAYRYLKVLLPAGVAIKIRDIRQRVWRYPEIKTGWFSCSDPLLNEAWEMGKETLWINKHQEYESCPRYEMQFFAGDGAIDALIDEYAFGGHDLMNASLSLKHEERSTGVLFTDKWNRNTIQWDYFAWRILCIHLHYKSTGDRAFLERYYGEAKTNLLWQLERLNSHGLIFQRPCFVSTYGYVLGQTEWTCSASRIGEKASLNSLLYASLNAMTEMAAAMGEDENAAAWRTRAAAVKAAINERLWDDVRGCYIDSLDEFIAQDANTLAILFGVADNKRRDRALATMKAALHSPYGASILDRPVSHTRGGDITVSPFMTALEAAVRFEAGDAEEALGLVRRTWGTMLKKGAKTFWEFTPNNAEGTWKFRAHAWSAGCTWLLSAYVAGIRSAAEGYRTVTLAPRPADLESFRCVVPTPRGFIALSCDTDAEGKRNFTVAIPKEITLIPDLPEGSTLTVEAY